MNIESEFPFFVLDYDEFVTVLECNHKLEFINYSSNVLHPFNCLIDDSDPVDAIDLNIRNNILQCPYFNADDFLVLNKNSSSRSIISMFLIIRSISKNIDEFYHEFFDDESQYDFLCFAETRLYPAITGLHNIPNFNLFSNERNSHSGGVCYYAN